MDKQWFYITPLKTFKYAAFSCTESFLMVVKMYGEQVNLHIHKIYMRVVQRTIIVAVHVCRGLIM